MNNLSVVQIFSIAILTLPAMVIAGSDPDPVSDRVTFEVHVEAQIDNDRLVTVLQVQAEDKSPAAVADEINRTMHWALERARAAKGVEVRSGAYSTSPVYDDGRVVRWRGRQMLHLESGEVARLSQLIGELQDRLQVQSMQFSVSSEALARAEEKLIERALAAWQSRAAVISKSLGCAKYERLEISIHGSQPGMPRPIHFEAMAAGRSRTADVQPPALEGGNSRLSVRAGGSIRPICQP